MQAMHLRITYQHQYIIVQIFTLSIKGNKSSEFEILQLDHTFKHRYHAIVSTESLNTYL